MNEWLPLITNLGDTAVLIPLSLAFALVVWRQQSPRAAWSFLRAFGLCALMTSLFKLAFISCGHAWHAGLTSPSGHTGLSLMVYGSISAAVLPRQAGPLRSSLALLATLLMMAIAVSRVMLGAHSVAEVTWGAMIGTLAFAAFVEPYRRLDIPRIDKRWLLAPLAVGLLLGYGHRLPFEVWLRQFATPLQVRCDAPGVPGRTH